MADELLEHHLLVLKEAQLVYRRKLPGLLQYAHYDLFAVDHRHDTYAQIELSTLVVTEREASVLRSPPLGDVEVRHDLESRHHSGLVVGRDGHLIEEQAV